MAEEDAEKDCQYYAWKIILRTGMRQKKELEKFLMMLAFELHYLSLNYTI